MLLRELFSHLTGIVAFEYLDVFYFVVWEGVVNLQEQWRSIRVFSLLHLLLKDFFLNIKV